MKIEKLDDKSIKITAPEGSKIGENVTPEQLLADLAKHVATPRTGGAEPRCAVCISD